MEILISLDKTLALFINNIAGRWWPIDELIKGLANDYFLIIGASLGLLLLWFGTADARQRQGNQSAVLQAMSALGLATWLISYINDNLFRTRPFDEIAVTTLLYQPTDSSFPSNSAAILFAIAVAVWLGNRKAGRIFFIIAAVHSFARVVAGMHYPMDVIGGALIGASLAVTVRWLFIALSPLVNSLFRLARAVFLA